MNLHEMIYDCRNVPSTLLLGVEESMAEFEEMKCDSVMIANALLWKAQQSGVSMNLTKINKILYIIYGFTLSMFKKRLTEEHPKAWPYGPVFPRVNKKVDPSLPASSEDYEKLPEMIRSIIDGAIHSFGNWTAAELSAWSHQAGGPWDLTYKMSSKWNTVIDDSLIYDYFSRFGKQENQNEG